MSQFNPRDSRKASADRFARPLGGWSLAGLLMLAVCLIGGGSVARAASTSAAAAPLVHFPADQAAHPAVSNEWWYVVGHLRHGARTFGYEVTAFKFHNIRPPGFSSPVTLYRTDIAITDEGGHRFQHQITYYFPQSVSLSSKTLDVREGTTRLRGSSAQNMSLFAQLRGGAINLRLSSRRGPLYVGGRGYLPFAHGYTYYYSLTDLATQGSIRIGATAYQVTGVSWLDHQWGDWQWQSIHGWTWMALQLDNGAQMSVSDFRWNGGRIRGANVLMPDGRLRIVRDATITATGTWRSPHTHALYPSGWIVRIPSLGAVFRITPTIRDQEMTTPSELRISYWEGSSRVQGTFGGKPTAGLGYTELTGYAAFAPRA